MRPLSTLLGKRCTRVQPNAAVEAQHSAHRSLRQPYPSAIGLVQPRRAFNAKGLRRAHVQVQAVASTLVATKDQDSVASVPAKQGLLYRFIVPSYVTHFGQELKVVGSLSELGDWSVWSAPSMKWSEGHRWTLEVTLPHSSFSFKVVVADGGSTRWEQGGNREVEDDGQAAGAPVDIVINLTCNFDATYETGIGLEVSKSSIEGALEMSKAKLEMLQRRKNKLQSEMEKLLLTGSSPATLTEIQSEAKLLEQALVQQATSVLDLGDVLNKSTSSPDAPTLMLPLHKMALPKQLAVLSSAAQSSASLALETPGQNILALGNGNGHANSPPGMVGVEGAGGGAAQAPVVSEEESLAASQAVVKSQLDTVAAAMQALLDSISAATANGNGNGNGKGRSVVQYLEVEAQLEQLLVTAEQCLGSMQVLGMDDTELNHLISLAKISRIELRMRRSEASRAAPTPSGNGNGNGQPKPKKTRRARLSSRPPPASPVQTTRATPAVPAAAAAVITPAPGPAASTTVAGAASTPVDAVPAASTPVDAVPAAPKPKDTVQQPMVSYFAAAATGTDPLPVPQPATNTPISAALQSDPVVAVAAAAAAPAVDTPTTPSTPAPATMPAEVVEVQAAHVEPEPSPGPLRTEELIAAAQHLAADARAAADSLAASLEHVAAASELEAAVAAAAALEDVPAPEVAVAAPKAVSLNVVPGDVVEVEVPGSYQGVEGVPQGTPQVVATAVRRETGYYSSINRIHEVPSDAPDWSVPIIKFWNFIKP